MNAPQRFQSSVSCSKGLPGRKLRGLRRIYFSLGHHDRHYKVEKTCTTTEPYTALKEQASEIVKVPLG